MKSVRNKTIDFELKDGKEYFNACYTEKTYNGELNAVICADLFSVIDRIADKSVDLLIVDPPYNLNKVFGNTSFKKTTFGEYSLYTEKWLDALIPKLKDNASVYVCCDWKSSLVIGPLISEKLFLRNRITWGREKGRGSKDNWKNSMEDVFYATRSNDFTFNLNAVKIRKKVLAPYRVNGVPKDWADFEDGKFRNTCPSNFWDDISVPYWSMAENTAHPTQKPEKLIAKFILASSVKGDVVFDPFGGSGTTAVVAKKLGRNYITVERDKKYCAWAQYRLKIAEENDTIQGYVGGVFRERHYSK